MFVTVGVSQEWLGVSGEVCLSRNRHWCHRPRERGRLFLSAVYIHFLIRIHFIRFTKFRFWKISEFFKNRTEGQSLDPHKQFLYIHFSFSFTMVLPPFFKASFYGNFKCVLIDQKKEKRNTWIEKCITTSSSSV